MKKIICITLAAVLATSGIVAAILLISRPSSGMEVIQADESTSPDEQITGNTGEDESPDNTGDDEITEDESPDNTGDDDTTEDESPGNIEEDDSDDDNSIVRYTVTFHSNGGSAVSPISVERGKSLGELPVPLKSDNVFIGWFTDNGSFEDEVYVTTIARSNLDLYACYFGSTPLSETDENTVTSVTGVAKDFSVNILSSNTSMSAGEVKSAMTFETITEQASEFGGITVSRSNGRYTVTATDEYTPGCSYSITLNSDALTFENEISSIRTCNLTVKLGEPVMNVQLCEDVQYIPVGDISQITQSGQSTDSLFAPLFLGGDEDSDESLSGTFRYSGDLSLAVGDQLAIYEGTVPDQRVAGEDYSNEDVSYVTVTAIDAAAGTIDYAVADPDEILFVPDLIPVKLSDDRDGDTGNHSLTIETEKMTYTDPADFTDFDLDDFGLNSATAINIGDYIIFYTDSDALENADSLIYVKITGVDLLGSYYVIAFDDSSKEDYASYMDISVSQVLTYEELSENIDLEEISLEAEQDVMTSGFAEAAADYLVCLAQADMNIQTQVCEEIGIEDFSVTTVETDASLLSDAPQINVQAQISKNLKHWSGSGLRCLVAVSCEIELGDNMKLQVSGTFVEEFKVEKSLTCKKIWKGLKVIDRQVIANIDVYSYTYLAMQMNLFTKNKSGFSDKLDIKETIDDLRDSVEFSTEEKNEEVQEFYELYQDMMAIDHGFIPLFSVTICQLKGGIDPLHIFAYAFTTEFVVSLNADVALGTQFGYEKATRFSFIFSLTNKTVSYAKTDLIDTNYQFTVYAMGTLAVRAGIKITLEAGLLDTTLDSIGISAEVGAYWQIWGFLYYHLEYANKVTTKEYAGACYMELGIYLSIKFQAQALNKLVSYSKELYGETWPLWSAGNQYYTYDFGYELTDQNDDIILKGDPRYGIPVSAYIMSQMDFKTGDVADKQCSASQFKLLIKNDPNHVFSVSDSGKITVTPPVGSDIATATLEVTWKTEPLVFTSAPISRTFTLIWDNLQDSYAINFDTNGGNNVQSIDAAYKSAINLPTPVRTGYTFNGWYTDNGTFQHAFTEKTMPAANYTVYAKWIADSVGYTVRHYQQNVNDSGYTLASTESLTGTAGSSVTPSPRSYTGFIAPSAQTVTLTGDGNTIVNYYYARNSYTLTFKPANGLADIVRTYPCGTEIIAPGVARTGYTFSGWNAAVAATMPAHALTYTAQWSKNSYTITYDLNGGRVSTANPGTYTVDSGAITLVNPTKDGYCFAGWTGTKLSDAIATVTIPTGSTENRYYAAKWVPANHTPYYVYHYREDISGSYTMLTIESMTGTTGANTQAASKSYSGFTAGSVVQQAIASDGTTVVKIYYTRNSYLLTFNANGGWGGTITSVKYGAQISAPTVTRTGYTFTGWDKEVAQTMPTSNTSYTAQWSVNTYNIAFNKNAADATGTMSDQGFTYDVSQSIANNAYARAGYAFSGWNTASDGSGTYYADSAAVINLTSERNGVVTLYVQWKSTSGSGTFEAKYSAEYQVFDFIMASSSINGNAYDSSWGSAFSSGGHQFTDTMLSGRYFMVCKTGDATDTYALYMYESDGTPIVSGSSANLYASSLIGSESNVNLTVSCKASLLGLYGGDWADGLVAVGNINDLWDEGFMFNSRNGFGYFIGGKTAYTVSGAITLSNHISSPTMDQLEAITDYAAGPLTED